MSRPPTPSEPIVLALARVAAGLALLSTGWSKLADPVGVMADFDRWGVPAPEVMGPLTGAFEIVGGALLAVGMAIRPAALVLAVDMVLTALTAGRIDGGPYLLWPPLGTAVCLVLAWRGGGLWQLGAAGGLRPPVKTLMVAVAAGLPATLAVSAGLRERATAMCHQEACPGQVPVPGSEGRARPAPGGSATQSDRPPSRTVVGGLEFPTGMAFTADGRMLVNERSGRVRSVRDGRLDPEPLATIPTTTDGERGLLGMAVPPDERVDPAVYVFATEPDGRTNRVLRVPLDGGAARPVVTGLPGGIYHDGGGVAFDDSGHLLVSNGESHSSALAQDPEVLGGKVYRYRRDGTVPADNPFGPFPALAIGLRNPFGLAVDPVSKAPFVTDNGPLGHDEVDRVDPGVNCGWPEVSGIAKPPSDLAGSYRPPLLDYPQTVVPTGIAFADPARAAPGYGGDLFFAAFGEGTIHRVRLDARRAAVVFDTVIVSGEGSVIALAWGPEGLYFSTATDVKVIPIAR
jgi:glucose/arabinose dehydrogenase/uncharacterized membrane protein YphA (DoxX/SURF4 family)